MEAFLILVLVGLIVWLVYLLINAMDNESVDERARILEEVRRAERRVDDLANEGVYQLFDEARRRSAG